MPVVANGIDMDWAFSRAHGNNTEFELRHSFFPNREARRASSSITTAPHGQLPRRGSGFSQRL